MTLAVVCIAMASTSPLSVLIRAAAVLTLATIVSIAIAGAEPLGSVPNPRKRDSTWVTDMPRALQPGTVARINAMSDELEKATGAELAVVVVASLDRMSVEEYAEKLFKLWGIGKAGKDNGLLLLWSTGDRRVRVEVGYGLEGTIPDGKAGAILDAYVIPSFKAGQFDAGIISGVEALSRAVGNEPVPLPSEGTEVYEEEEGFSYTSPTMFGVYGGVPAGLASLVGFRRWRRFRRRRCPQCQATMGRLGETEDDAHLQEGQVAEERVGSVDYDVWKCPSCAHHFTLRYPKWLTSYAKCPQCHNKTKSSTQTTLVSATTSSSGSARVDEKCAFCSYTNSYTKVLPRIQQSSSSSSGAAARASAAADQAAAAPAADTSPRRGFAAPAGGLRPASPGRGLGLGAWRSALRAFAELASSSRQARYSIAAHSSDSRSRRSAALCAGRWSACRRTDGPRSAGGSASGRAARC